MNLIIYVIHFLIIFPFKINLIIFPFKINMLQNATLATQMEYITNKNL